ncbi:thymidylate kinase-domain-containing protein [Apiospora kogelbergensis]|uniref:thymidylate kinase-domain-containing protein n=1 Tax=Apiospora kogelbergensis TaxID=1337665 RepID=UPI0031310291
MASINDLAAAATIASSAVAMQSSPTQKSSQPAAGSSSSNTQSSPPPPLKAEPPSPSTAASAATTARPTTPAAPDTPPSIVVATQTQTPAQPPQPQPPSQPSPAAAASSAAAAEPPASPQQAPTAPVLAAPQISPEDAASAQIPAPPPPPAPAVDSDEEEKARPKPVRGAFIVFEGMDRAGKTTQAKLLQQRFFEEGRDVKFMRFPDRTTPIGQMIDAYLKGQTEIEDHVIHLLFSANRWEALKTIQTTLAAGVSIVCDRYYHSGIVYSAAKQNPTLPLSWAKAPEAGLPRPDLVLFLDLDEAVARERGGWGGEVYEKGEMQRRVRELFWGLSMGDLGSTGQGQWRCGGGYGYGGGGGGADNSVGSGHAGATNKGPSSASMMHAPEGERGEFRQEEEDLQIVDASLDIEELHYKVWSFVQPRLEAVERGEVGDKVRVVR